MTVQRHRYPTGSQNRRPDLRTRSALTMIEVMIALAVIATGVMALLNGLYSQSTARQGVRDSERLVALTATIQERFLTQAWDSLGLATWSTPTLFNVSAPFSGGHTESELLSAGIISQPTGLSDLRLYVEYYLAQSQSTTMGVIDLRGLMDAQADANGDGIVDRFSNELTARAGYAANIANATAAAAAGDDYTVRYDSAPTASLPPDQPLAIRMVLVWRGGASGAFGVRPIPGIDGRMIEMILARGAN